jgi:hypothetical protein
MKAFTCTITKTSDLVTLLVFDENKELARKRIAKSYGYASFEGSLKEIAIDPSTPGISELASTPDRSPEKTAPGLGE